MESDILDSLEQLGYTGPLLEEEALAKASESGLSSAEYVSLCVWLGARLKALCRLEEDISASAADDSEGLQLEISGFLKEMLCPYPALVTGDIRGRLKTKDSCLQLILYLSSELQSARIIQSKRPQSCLPERESAALPDLKAICKALQLSEPNGVQASELFSSIETKIQGFLVQLPKGHMGKPLLKATLSSDQWARLEQVNAALSEEYACRRRMLVKRLDVTVQSFSWSERAKEQMDNMAKAYQPLRHSLSYKTSVGIAQLLAAREDLCNIVKTSSGSSREKTVCAVNKILMGHVPDRGGRPSEIDAPPPEMPPWQKRQDGGGRGGWGGRGGGRGGHWGGGGGSRGGGRNYGGKGGYKRY
ncbi:protein FAM98B [Amia ocellicauda]|uniref:protein FAM98B n=1 Tax=Amia ocellicauda TaxID=2972642 RepID=UPI003464CF2F